MDNRPIAVDLFAGAGGMSLGFEQAGFDIAAAIEIDPVHAAVHAYNFPNTTIIPHSVENISGQDIRNFSGIGESEVECVFGGAPCQGFSLIGKRAIDDPRNKLVLEFVRIVSELDARSFVFENVKGLTLGRHREFLSDLVASFEQLGYEIALPWKVLNAAHFGVPQNRERLFLMGSKKVSGSSALIYPEPFTKVPNSDKNDELPNCPTVFEAIGDLPDADKYKTLAKTDSVKTNSYKLPSAYTKELRCLSNNAWHFGYMRNWNPSELTSSARTNHTDISKRRFAETKQGSVEPVSRFFKLAKDGISNTLRAGTDGARGAFTSPRPIHPVLPRCITVREMARLHGFPDWFRFNVTKWHGARQIGNAVPPPLARAVASQIISAFGLEAKQPKELIDLGDPALLKLTVSQAAGHFKVDIPIQRRDQKSGNRKRKQIEIEQERLAAEQVGMNG